MVYRLIVVYFALAIFWRCPSQPFSFQYSGKHDLLVCRELASAQENLTPVLHGFAKTSRKHLDPYFGSYIDHAHHSWKRSVPVFHRSAKHAHGLFNTHVRPTALSFGKKTHTWSLPYQRKAHWHYKKHVHPHVNTFHKASKPYVSVYRRDVQPHVQQAVKRVQELYDAVWRYYEHIVHPTIKHHTYQSYLFTRRSAWPVARTHYFAHAHPHLSKTYNVVNKWIDALLVKYGFRSRSMVDKVLHNVKDTYRQTAAQSAAHFVSADSVPTSTSEAPPAATQMQVTEQPQIDPESGEPVEVVQKRLDEELARVDEVLVREEKAIAKAAADERAQLKPALRKLRQRNFAAIPDLVNGTMVRLEETLFARIYLPMLREAQLRADVLEKGDEPTDAWRTQVDAIADSVTDLLLLQHGDAHAALKHDFAVANRSAEREQALIEESIKTLRTQIGDSVQAFYDAIEDAEFQKTYYDNKGWDAGIKYRARLFREEMESFVKEMAPSGEDLVPGRLPLPNLVELEQEAASSVNALFWQTELTIKAMAERFKAQPALVLRRSGLGDVLVDVYTAIEMVREMGHDTSRTAALRLRKAVGDVREKLGWPRQPENGILHEVWDESIEELTEESVDDSIPVPPTTTGEWTSEEAVYDPEVVAWDPETMQMPVLEQADEVETPTEPTTIPLAEPESTPEPGAAAMPDLPIAPMAEAVADVVEDAATAVSSLLHGLTGSHTPVATSVTHSASAAPEAEPAATEAFPSATEELFSIQTILPTEPMPTSFTPQDSATLTETSATAPSWTEFEASPSMDDYTVHTDL